MSSIFEKWDNAINTESLAKDIAEASQNTGGGSYEEIAYGDYEVAVEHMEIKKSSKGDPMVTIWFKIVDGNCKGSMIFYNQVIKEGFQIHFVNELLRAMVSEMEDSNFADRIDVMKVDFKYSTYNELIMDIFEEISDNFEYKLAYKKGKPDKKGGFYSEYEIKEVYVLD